MPVSPPKKPCRDSRQGFFGGVRRPEREILARIFHSSEEWLEPCRPEDTPGSVSLVLLPTLETGIVGIRSHAPGGHFEERFPRAASDFGTRYRRNPEPCRPEGTPRSVSLVLLPSAGFTRFLSNAESSSGLFPMLSPAKNRASRLQGGSLRCPERKIRSSPVVRRGVRPVRSPPCISAGCCG